MTARPGFVAALAGCLAATAPATAQGAAKLAVGPDAGGYLCPDGRQLYVTSCYDESPNANCGVVHMHLPLNRGQWQVETTEMRSTLLPSVASCKIYPLQFRNGIVSLVLPKSAQPQAANAPSPKTSTPPVTNAGAGASAPAAVALPARATIRLPRTDDEKTFFTAIRENKTQLAINVFSKAGTADKPIRVPELTDEQGMTALHWATTNHNVAAIRWLLDKESVVDAADQKGRTPLMIALANKDRNAMSYLLNRGADARLVQRGHDSELRSFKTTGELVDFLINTAPPAAN